MKKLILSVFVAAMFASASYAQYGAQAREDAMSPEEFNKLLQDVSDYNKHSELNGIYYSRFLKNKMIVEYGLPSCPGGYTKYSLDKTINHGCESVSQFVTNVKNHYYELAPSVKRQREFKTPNIKN